MADITVRVARKHDNYAVGQTAVVTRTGVIDKKIRLGYLVEVEVETDADVREPSGAVGAAAVDAPDSGSDHLGSGGAGASAADAGEDVSAGDSDGAEAVRKPRAKAPKAAGAADA